MATLEYGPPADALPAIVGEGAVELSHEFGDEVRGQHTLAERPKNAALQLAGDDRRGVGAAEPPPIARTAPPLAANDGEGGVAYTAAHDPGQETLRPTLVSGGNVAQQTEPALYLRPAGAIDNPQFFDLGGSPFGLRVSLGDPAPGDRVLLEALPVVDDATVVKRVAQDAGLAPAVAQDSAGAPLAARGRGDRFPVERLGDHSRADPGKVVREYAADDRGLVIRDAPLPAFDRPAGVDRVGQLISVGKPSGDATGGDAAHLPAPGLLGQLLKVERGHRAAHADVQCADLALGQRDEANAGEAQALEDRGDVFLVAAQAVDRLRDHHIDPVELVEQCVEAWPVARSARQGKVGVDADDAPPLALGPFLT